MLKTFSTELTGEEKELLSTYEQFYRALEEGIHVPETEAQQHFIDVCHGRAFASTPHEIVWLKVESNFTREARACNPSGRRTGRTRDQGRNQV